MQPVGREAVRGQGIAVPGDAAGDAGGFVLPRLLRRPARTALRVFRGNVRLSRRAMLSVLALGLAAGAAFTVREAGGPGVVMARLAPSLGIGVQAYDISGNSRVSEIEIVSLLAPESSTMLLFYDVERARALLRQNPWIADAAVSKRYPARLAIDITERTPFAVWQSDEGLYLIDREGRKLGNYNGVERLPLMVGEGAAGESATILSTVARYPAIAARVKAYLKVGNRRWDLQLDNGTIVLLPEKGVAEGLAWLAGTDRDSGLLERDVERVDLRLEGRAAIRLSPGAADSVRAVREDQRKHLKDAQKERST